MFLFLLITFDDWSRRTQQTNICGPSLFSWHGVQNFSNSVEAQEVLSSWVHVYIHIYLQIKDNEKTKLTSSFTV